MARIFDQGDRILRDIFLLQSIPDRCDDRLVGFQCIAPAAEDHSISCFKAESERIRRHIRSRLIDDPDDA